MRVLFLWDNFDQTLNYREVHYAKEMAKKNEVFVLTSTNRPSFLKLGQYPEGVTKWEGVTIIRKKPFFKLRDIMLWVKDYKKVISQINPDLIHTVDGVRISPGIMGLWAKKHGYKIVYDQENRVAGGWLPLSWLKFHLIGGYLERKMVNAVDLIRTVTPASKEYVISRYNADPKKIVLSTLGFDEEKFYPSKKLRDEFRKENGIKKEYVVGITGKISPWKKIETVIEAFKDLNSKYKLLIFGKFSKEYYNELKEKYGSVKNVEIREEFMDLKKLNEFYNGVDLMVWTHVTISYFEALGANTPILVPYFNGSSHLEKKSNGIFYYGKGKEIFDKSDKIINENLRTKEINRVIASKPEVKKINSQAFSWKNIVKKMEADYKKLLK